MTNRGWYAVKQNSNSNSITLSRKGYNNHHCHNKPPDRKWGWSVDDIMPRRDGLRIWKILKKIQLSSDHDVKKLSSDHGFEKLRVHCGQYKQTNEFLSLGQRMEFSAIELSFDHCVEKLGSDHGVEKLGSENDVEKLRVWPWC